MPVFAVKSPTDAGLLLALGLMLLISYITFQSTVHYADSSRWIRHTYSVITQLNLVQFEIKNAETAQRGYLLTEDDTHLQLYDKSIQLLPKQVARLKALTKDNPLQQKEIGLLEQLVSQKMDIMQATLKVEGVSRAASLATERGTGQNELYAMIAQGKLVMDRISLQIADMSKIESGLLNSRAEQEQRDTRLTRLWISLGNVAAIALLVFSFWRIRQEMTKRKALLRQTEAHAREIEDIYNNAPCAYHSVDKNGLIIRMNNTALSWLGYTADEVVRKKLHPELMTAESAQRFYNEIFPQFKAQGYLKDIEFDYLCKDGKVFKASLNATTVYDEHGDYLFSRTSFYDITERKLAEQKVIDLNRKLLQKAAELEVTNKELESFSYSVSHDLRSPLRAVDGYAHMLEEDYSHKLDDEGMRLLNVIRTNSKKMGNLIDDLLEFSRLGRKPLELVLVDMNSLFLDVWLGLTNRKEPIFAEFEQATLPSAHGDPALLRQVIFNLLSNAAKYSSKRSDAKITVAFTHDNDEVIYSVRDNGVGFNMKYYNKLFGVFQRLHRDDEFPGTGVGLAIVERIITRHGGRIWAESVIGEGSLFSFSLPTGEML